ncbi:cora-like Mg2+ transporter protein-domain-containing protein [Mycena amicta]|nr:cora-like Mg2+ transporter protein-domain-containing protein [Mycena amicta]
MSSLRRRVLESQTIEVPRRRPPPSHRHNSPSAPWPWINLHDDIDQEQLATPLPPVPPPCDHTTCEGRCWKDYPQSRFPNWTPSQIRRSRIHKAITDDNKSRAAAIYYVDVSTEGVFKDSGKFVAGSTTDDAAVEEMWNQLVHEDKQRSPNVRVRALFLESMSGAMLQQLGAKYNIEPFFFSSSLGWIPSRYQEEVRPMRGDHLTVTLIFLRTMDHPDAKSLHTFPGSASSTMSPYTQHEQVIDTQAPLFLHSGGQYLILDLLAVHLIRNTDGNTLISYHNSESDTTATYLHERIRFAGQSVYWQNIFSQSPDPTFVLLTFIWHAIYAWDEALEHLYAHICYIEAQVINTSDPHLTRELHVIRAHLLHHSALLEDFRKTVDFVLDTPNPAMDALPEAERVFSRQLLNRECRNLLSEIQRLEGSRTMQDKRLKNVMDLVFSSVNIEDSRRMKELTEAAMKQIAYLSMIFLPASFVAGIFGMNIAEINPGTLGSLGHYFETALPLTLVTIWAVMALQGKYLLGRDATVWMRLIWPVTLMRQMIRRRAGYDMDAPLERKWPDGF